MTMTTGPICLSCARYRSGRPGVWGLFCEAFGDAPIPKVIIESRADHRVEHVEGDHGLLWAPKDATSAAEAQQAWVDAHPSLWPKQKAARP